MAVSEQTIAVQGLREMQRAFRVADRSLQKELRHTLREVAEPVRADAERLALARIPRIGVPWSQMRVGVTTTSVYVASKRRGTRLPQRRRPNLADLLLGRAMEPALHENLGVLVDGFNRLLDTVAEGWEAA